MVLSLSGRPYGGRKEMVSVGSLPEAAQHGLRRRVAGRQGAAYGTGFPLAGCLTREEEGVRERRGQSRVGAQPADGHVAIGTASKRIELPIVEVRLEEG